MEILSRINELVNIKVDQLPYFPDVDVSNYKVGIKEFVLKKLYEAGAIPSNSEEHVTISILRKFGAAFIVTGTGRIYITDEMGNEPIPFEERYDISQMLKLACDRKTGGVYCYHKSILMTYVYAAFGYESFCVAFGRGSKSNCNHTVNIVLDPLVNKWVMQDSLLDCYFLDNTGEPLDFFTALSILARSNSNQHFLFQTIYEALLRGDPQEYTNVIGYRNFYGHDSKKVIEEECSVFALPHKWESQFLFPQTIFGHPAVKEFATKYVNILFEHDKTHLASEWIFNQSGWPTKQ